MATQKPNRNAMQGDRNFKAKRKRNTKRAAASGRQGFPERNAPAGKLSDDQQELSEDIAERTSKMVPRPSTANQRQLARQLANGD